MSGGFPELLFPSLLGRRIEVPGDPAFVPTSISGCVLWLRGDLGVTLSGSNVASWANQAGANHSAAQGTDALRPQMSTINSKAALVFNGSSQYLADATVGTPILAADAKYTCFVVWEHTSGTGIQVPWRLSEAFAASAQEMYLYTGTASNQGGHLLRTTNALGTALSGKKIVTGHFEAGLVQAYSGSTLHASAVATPTHNAFASFSIGAYAASSFFGGKIGEIILFNRGLSASERSRVWSYLSSFWAI